LNLRPNDGDVVTLEDAASTVTASAGDGLTSEEAARRLQRYGANAVPEESRRPLLILLHKLWGPVPWMLELTLATQLVLGRYTDAAVIGALLLLNAVLGFFQEDRAGRALASLRQQVTVQARVRRDGRWQLLPSAGIVPGDIVRLRVGDLVPADVGAIEGQVAVDQSALTGESIAVDIAPPDTAHAGTMVKRGELTGEVVATGTRTAFGKTVELIQTAKTASHLESLILTIVKYLIAIDSAVVAYAWIAGLPPSDVLPFALILLVASVPVALPATFTLPEAVGALDLAARGVLVTRLSAVEEAAAMDVLSSDKTGTITRNELTVAAVRAMPGHEEDDVLRFAALACDEATQDPIDLAILRAARSRGLAGEVALRQSFVPFDPSTKRSEATAARGDAVVRVLKGAPAVIAAPGDRASETSEEVERLAASGCRVIAVAAGPEGRIDLIGLVGLQDPPREDSAAAIRLLKDMGIRVLMVTGDAAETARAVGAQVGLGQRTCPRDELRHARAPDLVDWDVFAGIYPEDKLRIVESLQSAGRTVGMTGDGVNDAPALKQAQVGIAVANATDVAKSAGSMILTNPGLGDVVAAVETGRRIYQRMLTYTPTRSSRPSWSASS
jgi:H+-transporting ATPase